MLGYGTWERRYKCSKCGEMTKANSTPENNRRMKDEGICSDCDYWMRHVENKDNDNAVRINGCHYIIGPESGNERPMCAGCGGRKFIILFNDGRKVTTTNLWCQGTIPTHFVKLLPDNACFVSNK